MVNEHFPVPREPDTDEYLDSLYAEMAADAEREAEAMEWIEGLIGDIEFDE